MLPIQRLGAAIEVVLCSGFPTQLLLIGLLTGFGLRPRTEDGALSPPFIFTLSLLDTALVIGLILFFLTAHRERPGRVLLGMRSIGREALAGIGILPLIFVLVLGLRALILTFAPSLHNVPRNPFEDMLQTRSDAVQFAIVATLAGGVREEIQRGFILHRFREYLGGGWVGLVLYSALFGLGHIEQGYDAALTTALLGAMWSALYLVRQSIVAPIVSHAGFNLLQLAAYLANGELT